jgi:hypothetical protein
LDSEDLKVEQDLLVSHWPKPLKNDGRVQVWVRTAGGSRVPVWVTYYRRKGQRRAGKRYAGLYAGLVLLGIDERCTPALAAEVSLLAAMLGSLDEARDVLAQRVVISTDGGRIRLRESKRGPKTNKGRRRYSGAWREPKVLIIYVVDAEGKREARFAPVINATLKGPDAVFALLHTDLQRLRITQADQGMSEDWPCS